jgi:hypothetical protein
MTREEFIDKYLKGSNLEEYRTADGYHIPKTLARHAVPCACGEDICEGWAMISDEEIEHHLQFHYPKAENGTFILDEYSSEEIWKAANALCKIGTLGYMRLYTGTVLYGWPQEIEELRAEREAAI